MAYGYYSDPGNTTGNTGTNTQESFIERQKRLQQASQPTTAKPTATSSGTAANGGITGLSGLMSTPVGGSGKIPDPAPAPQAAPAPAPAAAPPPPPPPPAPSNPEWTDPNYQSIIESVKELHPEWAQYKAWKDATAASQAAPAAAATGTNGATKGTAEGGAADAAKSGMFTQYATPEQDFQNWQQQEMVSNLLANPHTLNDTTVQQMKQKAMEDSLFMQKQEEQQAEDELAARGFSGNGGLAAAQRRKTQENMMNAILGSNRDIDIMRSQQNRADELNALQAAEAIMGGQVGRSGEVFGNILAGQGANRDDYWKGGQLALQEKLGLGGLDVDKARIGQAARDSAGQLALGDRRLSEDARQFNSQNALGWAGLNMNGQNATIQQIMQMIGGG